MSELNTLIHSLSGGEVQNQIRLGPTYAPEARYVHAAFVKGDISYDEAYDLLVHTHGFGKEGAKEALEFDRKYPHMVSIPNNYQEKLYGNEQSI